MTTFRMQRINKQIQREISLMLGNHIKNETAKMAIITDVDCSRDLERAKVYFTTLDPSDRERVGEALLCAAGAMRSHLGKLLAIRQVPSLSFHIDSSADYGQSIDLILDSLRPVADGNEDAQEQAGEEEQSCSRQAGE